MQCRKTMQAVKSKDTTPEFIVRKLLFGMGYRYRLYRLIEKLTNAGWQVRLIWACDLKNLSILTGRAVGFWRVRSVAKKQMESLDVGVCFLIEIINLETSSSSRIIDIIFIGQ